MSKVNTYFATGIYFSNSPSHNNLLHNSKGGIRYNDLEIDILNNDLKNLILQSKSIYHSIKVINNRGFNFKQQTIYKQIERGQLSIESCDLPRNRKGKNKSVKDKNYKRINVEGHTYEDYEKYKKEHKNAIEIQMDTVEGIKESNAPVFLTLEIVEINFIFIFKINNQTINEVSKKLEELKNVLGNNIIDNIFEILLTDNGKEFNNHILINDILSKTNIFYCHPYSSYEKGSIENNHEFIRRVIPKGVSLKTYNQQDIDLLCSHINSLYRKSLDGKCPFDLVNKYISLDKLEKLNLKKIDDDKVNLTPQLLGSKNIENIKKYLDKKEIKKANIIL